ncbi:MAG: transposase [Planctomycetota bacterium]|jgi:hypothetical protein
MMTKEGWKLTHEQWKKVEKFLPKPKPNKKGGRPWADNRKVFEGIGYSLDSSNWSTLGRFAKTIPKSFNLLAKAQALGGTRPLAQGVESVSFRA